MTIQELCDRLSQFPPNTPVVVKGYEGGFNDVQEVEALEIQLNVNKIWFYGAHGTNDHQHKPIEGIRKDVRKLDKDIQKSYLSTVEQITTLFISEPMLSLIWRSR